MHLRTFAKKELYQKAYEVRVAARIELEKLALNCSDTVKIIIYPSTFTADFFSVGEEAVWLQVIKRIEKSLLLSALITLAGFFCSYATLSNSPPNNTILSAQSLSISAIVLIVLIANTRKFKEIAGLYRRGYCTSAQKIFHAYGRSLIAVGEKGIYVSFNDGGLHEGRRAEFFPFEALHPVEFIQVSNQILIELLTIDGEPIRTLIYSDRDHVAANAALREIEDQRSKNSLISGPSLSTSLADIL